MEKQKLRSNQLNFFEVIALSVAIMAPTFAMASNTPWLSSEVGFSLSLVFIITMVIVALVSISFIKFNQKFSTAGSVYSFTTTALGKNVGVVSGWAMFLTYAMFATGCASACGNFVSTFIAALTGYNIPAVVCLAIIWLVSFRDIKMSTILMLILEGASILLLLVLAIVILSKTGIHTGLNLKPFTMGSNTVSNITHAVVFGFLSFAGFEGASSLGEESKNPKKYIPLAIILTIVFIGVFFVFVSYAQVEGFGATSAGIKQLSGSSAPLTDLSKQYIAGWFSLIITAGAAISAFTCSLGSVAGASRVFYSMSYDGNLPKPLAKVHHKFSSPYFALGFVVILALVLNILTLGTKGLDDYNYFGTIGGLSIILCYLITVIGSMVYFTKKKEWKIYNLILPALGLLALLYTFYANIYPSQAFPFNLFPYIVLGVLVIGSIFSFIYKNKYPEQISAE
jgi:amino acid transporter